MQAQVTSAIDTNALRAGSVEGTLTGPSGKSVTGVTVSSLETGASATVDAHGHYTLSNLAPGTYTLIASGEGFSRLKITDVVVKPDTDTSLGIEEMPVHIKDGEVRTMEEVVVSAKKDVETMEKYVVTDQKTKPFSDRNVDLPRGIDDAQPYYIFNSQTITNSGALNIEDFLKQHSTMVTTYVSPSQLSGGQGSAQLGGGSALLTNSTINLRGLGSNQTLILVDGRRSAVSILNNTSQPDINGIPLAAIDRIEILPSSASAIYGGSAVGGVINIILKQDYHGGEIKAAYESTMDGYGPIKTLDGIYGFTLNGGKTRVMISAHYSEETPYTFQDRAGVTRNYINEILVNAPMSSILYGSNVPLFGSTTNIGRFLGNLTLTNGTSLNSTRTYISPGTAPGTDLTASLLANAGNFNLNFGNGFGPGELQQQFGSESKVKSAMATIHQELTPKVEAFGEFSIMSNIGSGVIAPIPGNNGYLLAPGAPNDPFSRLVFLTLPNTLSAIDTSDNVTRTITVGLTAQLPVEWKAELDYTWSQNASESSGYSTNAAALQSALSSGLINPFVDTNAYPLNLAPYVSHNIGEASSTLNDLAMRSSGPLFSLPWGRPTLTFAYEHRKEANANGNSYGTDPNTVPANPIQIITLAQAQSINSLYTELEIPLITEKNRLPLLQSLDAQVAIRDEKYSVGAGTPTETIYPTLAPFPEVIYGSPTLNGGRFHYTAQYSSINPTVGLSYKPVQDVILRASYATAFLPPTYSQLLPNPVPSPFPARITDPTTNTSYNVQILTGGNPNLTPEKSKNWDAGFIYEPKGLFQGFRFDAEYYHIEKDNTIGSLSAQQIVSAGSALASRVTRDPSSGLITLVNTSLLNLNKLVTEGWDVSIDYRKKTGIGTVELYAVGTEITHYAQQTSATTPLLEYAGYVDSGGPGKLKGNATLTWECRNWTLGWTTTYYGRYNEFGAPGDPVDYQGAVNPTLDTVYTNALGRNTVASQMYHEIFAIYHFNDRDTRPHFGSLFANVTLQVGVKDIFNKAPPFDPFMNPYFYSAFGDPRMRDYWISLKKSF